jgi:Flp pilus assembly pilin Flp
MRKILRNRKGQGLVEYALIIAGVALIAAVGISIFGHKVSDMIATVAAILPGAHSDDNAPISSGHLIETTTNANGAIAIDTAGINAASGTYRLQQNLFGNGTADPLVVETDKGSGSTGGTGQ